MEKKYQDINKELMAFIDKNQCKCCYLFIMQTHKITEKEDLINLSDASIIRVKEGYLINLPKPQILD